VSNPLWTLSYILAIIFLPPLAVGLRTGDPCEVILNIVFLLFGWIPGCIHAGLTVFTRTRCSCFPETAMAIPPEARIEVSTRDSEKNRRLEWSRWAVGRQRSGTQKRGGKAEAGVGAGVGVGKGEGRIRR
jgi:uncharacterized membrane protein YqaE (UPF0057 family)